MTSLRSAPQRTVKRAAVQLLQPRLVRDGEATDEEEFDGALYGNVRTINQSLAERNLQDERDEMSLGFVRLPKRAIGVCARCVVAREGRRREVGLAGTHD